MQRSALVEHALRDEPPGRDQAAARVGDAEAQREIGGAHADQLFDPAPQHAHGRGVGVRDPAVVAEQQHAVGDALDDGGGQAPDAVEARRGAKRHRVQQQAGERDEDPALGGLDARDEYGIVGDGVQDDVGQQHPHQARDRERRRHRPRHPVRGVRALGEIGQRLRIDAPRNHVRPPIVQVLAPTKCSPESRPRPARSNPEKSRSIASPQVGRRVNGWGVGYAWQARCSELSGCSTPSPGPGCSPRSRPASSR